MSSLLTKLPYPLPKYIEKVNEIKKNEIDEKELYCKTCCLYLNSIQQLQSHMKSTKHKMVELGLIDKKAEQGKKREVVSNHHISKFYFEFLPNF